MRGFDARQSVGFHAGDMDTTHNEGFECVVVSSHTNKFTSVLISHMH